MRELFGADLCDGLVLVLVGGAGIDEQRAEALMPQTMTQSGQLRLIRDIQLFGG